MSKLDDLERLAREATPGPWNVTDGCAVFADGQPQCVRNAAFIAAFIAAADPTTVLKLVAVAKAALEWERVSFASDDEVERGEFSEEQATGAAYRLAGALAALQGDER